MSASRLIGAACVLVLLSGCEQLLGGPDYYVAEASTAAQLQDAFAGSSARCSGCLSERPCDAAFRACAELEGCADLALCSVEQASPAADAWCVAKLQPTAEQRSAVRALSACFRGCVAACDGGGNFACVNDYTWPSNLPHTSVRLTQTLSFVFEQAMNPAAAGVRVTVCPPDTDCDAPLRFGDEPLVVTTDAKGTYSLEVPISTAPDSVAGFRGFRLVEGEGFLPHRLQTNARILVDQSEQTKLLGRDTTDVLLPALGATETLGVLALQVFDCRSVGASDIYFTFPNTPDASVRYKDDVSPISWRPNGTLASQEGAAIASGLAPRQWHRVEARTAEGDLVSRADVYIPGDALTIFGMYPDPGGGK